MKREYAFINFGTKRSGRSCKWRASDGYTIVKDGDTVTVSGKGLGTDDSGFDAPWSDVVEAHPVVKRTPKKKERKAPEPAPEPAAEPPQRMQLIPPSQPTKVEAEGLARGVPRAEVERDSVGASTQKRDARRAAALERARSAAMARSGAKGGEGA